MAIINLGSSADSEMVIGSLDEKPACCTAAQPGMCFAPIVSSPDGYRDCRVVSKANEVVAECREVFQASSYAWMPSYRSFGVSHQGLRIASMKSERTVIVSASTLRCRWARGLLLSPFFLIVAGFAVLDGRHASANRTVSSECPSSDYPHTTSTPTAPSEKRVAIIYSEADAEMFSDTMLYSQLFMAVQHQSMMAGIPFDLLQAEALTDVTNIVNYDALVFPCFTHVRKALLAQIESTLQQAVYGYGMGIVTAGEFMTRDENGVVLPGDPHQRMKQLLGLQQIDSVPRHPIRQLQILLQKIRGATYRGMMGVLRKIAAPRHPAWEWLGFLLHCVRGRTEAVTVTAGNIRHPVMEGCEPREILFEFKPFIRSSSFDHVPNQPVAVLARQTIYDETHAAILATETGSRNVHFANWRLMGCSNLVWQALQWVVYGDETAVGLNLGRNRSIFISRCDMDESQYPHGVTRTEPALYDLLTEWKRAYNFVGSYYINIGNHPGNNMYTDWEVSRPLYRKYITLGNEIGTHSYTHPFFVTRLTPEELEFEFLESKRLIEKELDTTVFGAAIPGNRENLAVANTVSRYLGYLSGNHSGMGPGYPGAFGYLTPDCQMVYLAPNLDSDFMMVGYRGWVPSRAEVHWLQQYSNLTSHASQPLIHWPWHDYGPTDSNAYTVEMYSFLLEMAYNDGAEFTTAADVYERIKTSRCARLEVGRCGTEVITATVTVPEGMTSLGKFSLKVYAGTRHVI